MSGFLRFRPRGLTRRITSAVQWPTVALRVEGDFYIFFRYMMHSFAKFSFHVFKGTWQNISVDIRQSASVSSFHTVKSILHKVGFAIKTNRNGFESFTRSYPLRVFPYDLFDETFGTLKIEP